MIFWSRVRPYFNPLNTKLNPIYHFLALLGTHPILHISGVRVKPVCFMPFSYNAPYQFTTLLNLSPIIFNLTLFSWFIVIYLFFSYGNITFGLCLFDVMLTFS